MSPTQQPTPVQALLQALALRDASTITPSRTHTTPSGTPAHATTAGSDARPGNLARNRGGSDTTGKGPIREVELPHGLPPTPSPSPALPASVMRRRRDGSMAEQVGTLPDAPSPYGRSPSTHPDTGAPMGKATGARCGPRWFDALPASDRYRPMREWRCLVEGSPNVAHWLRIMAA